MINKRLADRISFYFDILNVSVDVKDWERAQVLLAKLSVYYTHFDDIQTSMYHDIEDIVERETAIVLK